jgi:hypothetical protein
MLSANDKRGATPLADDKLQDAAGSKDITGWRIDKDLAMTNTLRDDGDARICISLYSDRMAKGKKVLDFLSRRRCVDLAEAAVR